MADPNSHLAWAQLTFVEDDPMVFDISQWEKVLDETRSQAICISAGGYVAFYPSSVPHHYVSRHLGDRDLLGEIITAAKERDMAVMARIDPHAIHHDAMVANPGWVSRDEHGNPQRHWAYPEVYLSCVYGSYSWVQMTHVIREIVQNYSVDYIFANRWQGHGPSHSAQALELFQEHSGLERFPSSSDRQDGQHWQSFRAWHKSRMSSLVRHWSEAIKEVKPEVKFVPNLGSFTAKDLDEQIAQEFVPFLTLDQQSRQQPEGHWVAGRHVKRARASHPDKSIGLITSVGPESSQYRWKDSVHEAAETATWMADGMIHGAFPWFTKFSAKIYDDRWIAPVSDSFNLWSEFSGRLQTMAPHHKLYLWDSSPTTSANSSYGAAVSGMYQILVELTFAFGVLNDDSDIGNLSADSVIVIPELDELDDKAAAQLEEFVTRGGKVLITGMLPADSQGTRVLQDHFTSAELQLSEKHVRNNYIIPTPGNSEFEGMPRIIGGTRIIDCSPILAVQQYWKFVPPHPDLPMEEVYPRSEPTRPAVVKADIGAGAAVNILFNISEVYNEFMFSDHKTLIENSLRNLLGFVPIIELKNDALLDISVWHDSSQVLWLALNLNDTAALRGQRRSFQPITGASALVNISEVQQALHLDESQRFNIETWSGKGWQKVEGPFLSRTVIEVPLPQIHDVVALRITRPES